MDPEIPENAAVNDEGENKKGSDSKAIVEPLDPEEAKKFQDFDPKLKNQETWQPPASMTSFLGKYFNQCLEGEEHQAILEDIPKPQCEVLQAPKLDLPVREQLWEKVRTPSLELRKPSIKFKNSYLK